MVKTLSGAVVAEGHASLAGMAISLNVEKGLHTMSLMPLLTLIDTSANSTWGELQQMGTTNT